MAKSIVYSGKKSLSDFHLYNGDIVVVYSSLNLSGTKYYYLVSSYRGDMDKYTKNRSQYCSFINILDGNPKFVEPCSRDTTIEKVLAHIKFPNAVIEVLPKESFSISIIEH